MLVGRNPVNHLVHSLLVFCKPVAIQLAILQSTSEILLGCVVALSQVRVAVALTTDGACHLVALAYRLKLVPAEMASSVGIWML